MGQPKKPRRAYRPRKMIIPPAFATTCDMDTRLGLRMREAVDALVTGSGDWDDMMGCDSELIVGIPAAHCHGQANRAPGRAGVVGQPAQRAG